MPTTPSPFTAEEHAMMTERLASYARAIVALGPVSDPVDQAFRDLVVLCHDSGRVVTGYAVAAFVTVLSDERHREMIGILAVMALEASPIDHVSRN